MRLQYFLYDRFRIAYLLGVEVKHIILEIGLREITGGQSSNEDQGHSSAKVVSSPLVDKGPVYHAGHQLVFTGPSWCLCGQLPGIQLAVRHLLDLAVLLAAVRVFFARSLLSLVILIMPCRLFVAQYLYNIHMRWLQYLRVRNSKYIQFKGLDNSRLHVAGRDTSPLRKQISRGNLFQFLDGFLEFSCCWCRLLSLVSCCWLICILRCRLFFVGQM